MPSFVPVVATAVLDRLRGHRVRPLTVLLVMTAEMPLLLFT
jgi:hypothetical protein